MTGVMTHRPENPGRELNLTRLAWLVSIAAPVVLIGLLCLVKAASATAAANPAPELPAAPMVEDEEEGEEACFEWEVGVLECEEPESAAEEGPYPPEECLLRTAQARVVSSPSHNRLRFIVRYSMVVPTRAYLDFEVHKGHDPSPSASSSGTSGRAASSASTRPSAAARWRRPAAPATTS